MTNDVVSVEGLYYSDGKSGIADGDSFVVTTKDQHYNSVVIHSIIHGGSCDVKYYQDTNDDGSFDLVVTVDSLSGSGISMGNELELGNHELEKIEIVNTSGSTVGFGVTGMQVSP